MNVRDNIGQLFIIGINGLTLSESEKNFIENENIGGVILFANNYENPAQVAELVNSIQALRKEYPLFISIDQEGGRVIRFTKPFTQFPSMMSVAKTGSPKICYQVHKILAEELSACGINLDFSPVCDILTNPKNKVIGDRAFGHDGETVSKFISSAIRGLQTNGNIACAKHFPGHGSTFKDSHFDLPIVKTSLEQLEKEEFIPFVKAVKSQVEMVMMAHLLVDVIDKNYPCTLSKAAYKLLRTKLKYKKIIITDDMMMKALTEYDKNDEAGLLALDAGADMVIYRDPDKAKLAFEKVKDALKTKKLMNEQMHDKISRVLACKKQYLSNYSPIYIPKISEKVGTKSSQIFLEDLISKIG